MYHAKEQLLKTDRMQMWYLTFGSGTKPLVMLQGLNTRGIRGAANGLAWMYRKFAKDYKVYLFDRRENLPEDVTIRELAEDLAEAMDALDIRQADVLAVSQGGMIAQYLTMDRPDLVNRMVLAVTLSRNNAVVTTVIGNWIQLTQEHDWKSLVADMAEKLYSDAYLNRYRLFLPLLTMVQKPKDVERFITLAKSCLTCNTYEMLDRVQCPVLVIGGYQDRIVTGEASVEMAERLGCPLYMYEDLGHGAYEEASDFQERAYRFLQEI